MWARRAETLWVKLPLKLLFPLNTLIFHRLLLQAPPKSWSEKCGNPAGEGMERQEGQRAAPLIIFRCFPKNTTALSYIDTFGLPSKQRSRFQPRLQGTYRCRLALAQPLWSWPGDAALIHSTCTVAALPNALSPEEFNPIETLKKPNSLGSLQLCPLPQTHRASPEDSPPAPRAQPGSSPRSSLYFFFPKTRE